MIILPNIRLASQLEAAAIARMSRDYIEHGLGWSWTPERVSRAIEDRATNVIVSHDGETLLGFGIMSYGEAKAHLVLLSVEPARRQCGLGAALLGWLEKCALTAGLPRVQLEARADNPAAVHFYTGQGYQIIAASPGYYQGSVDAVRMEKRLGNQIGN